MNILSKIFSLHRFFIGCFYKLPSVKLCLIIICFAGTNFLLTLSAFAASPSINNKYFLTAKIYNRGGSNSGPFFAEFTEGRDGQFLSNGVVQSYIRKPVDDIAAGAASVVTCAYWRPTSVGWHSLTISVDNANLVVEGNESNNVAAILQFVDEYDLLMTRMYAWPEKPVVNQTNIVYVDVFNRGTGDVIYVKVPIRHIGPGIIYEEVQRWADIPAPAYVPARLRYPNSVLGTGEFIDECWRLAESIQTTKYAFSWVPDTVGETSLFAVVNCLTNVLGLDMIPPTTDTWFYVRAESNIANNILQTTNGILEVVADSDGDGMPDWWEASNSVSSASADADGEGLLNLEEFLAGTDPNDTDSDDEGLNDFLEVMVTESNPLDPDTDHGGANDKFEWDWHFAYTEQDLFDPDDDWIFLADDITILSTNFSCYLNKVDIHGTNQIDVVGGMIIKNFITGEQVPFDSALIWTSAVIRIEIGENIVGVYGTNQFGDGVWHTVLINGLREQFWRIDGLGTETRYEQE